MFKLLVFQEFEDGIFDATVVLEVPFRPIVGDLLCDVWHHSVVHRFFEVLRVVYIIDSTFHVYVKSLDISERHEYRFTLDNPSDLFFHIVEQMRAFPNRYGLTNTEVEELPENH